MRVRIIVGVVALVFVSLSGWSQRVHIGTAASRMYKGAELVRDGKHGVLPSYIRFRQGQEIDLDHIWVWMKKNFRLQTEMDFELVNQLQDKQGHVHYRYSLTLDGKKVKFATWILHTYQDKVYSLNGMLHNDIPVQPATLSESEALEYAKTHIGASLYKWEIPAEEAHIKTEQLTRCEADKICHIKNAGDFRKKIAEQKLNCAGNLNNDATYFPKGELVYVPLKGSYKAEDYRLAWKFDIYAHEPVSRSIVYVNASSGEIINEDEIIHEADTPGTAETAYSGTQSIVADSFGGGYRLRESGRGNGINTYDMNEGTTYGAAVDFTDADNYWNNVNADQDEVATDAHWGAEMTYDYFLNEHGRNSIDGAGFTLNSYVHYDNGFINAFWDGSRMTYGDGGGGYSPLTALDIAGHEIGHGLCNFTADLVYQDESGALNESFSDIWGACIEEFARPSNWNWLIGEDIGSALRSMSNPNAGGDPDTYFGTNWAPLGGPDNGGVHTNSGVQNFWFYLLTDGGSGTNDNGDSYSVTGQGFTTSSQIAFRNLTVYLTDNSEFADARFYAIQSAIDLFGGCSPEVEATTDAWYAVGVGAAYNPSVIADFNAPEVQSCSAPFTVDFSNLSNNGISYQWDFGDGGTSTSTNPSHTYTALGTYDVQLITDGGLCGIDTVVYTAYVEIDTSIACTVILPASGTADNQTACAGTIYDSGGSGGDYGANEDATVTISPVGASTVDLTFPFFDIEPGSAGNCDYDYMEIYDGPTTGSPLIDRYCNDNVPTGTISSTGSSITIYFHSDGGLEMAGFQASWNCNLSTVAPTANFVANTTSTCTGEVQFTDLSTDGPTQWDWDFGDGNTSSMQNPSHTYTANGTYTVELTATNANGSNAYTETSYITVALPTAPTADHDTVCVGDSAVLMATGTSNVVWYDAPTGGNQVGSGSTFTTPALSSTTTYYAQEEVAQPVQNVGPVDNTFGGGGYFNGDQHLLFDVYTPVVLESVWVDAQGGGNRTIELRDNTDAVLQSAVINIPDGQSRITLNFDLPVGTDLQLGTLNGSSPSLFRNNSGPSYPYDLPGILSITESSAGVAGYYYFFYDWEVREPNCTSAAVPVTAEVSASSDATITTTGPFCISDGTVALSAVDGGGTWTGTGVSGSSFDPASAGVGTHTITYTITGSCGDMDTEDITVTAAFDATIATTGPFCESDSVITMTAADAGGVWTGSGMSGNQFDPSAAGIGNHEIIYTISGSCGSADTTSVQVLDQADATITPAGPFCVDDPIFILTATDAGGTWSGAGVAGNTFDASVAGVGTHTITYTIAGTCGDTDMVTFEVDGCTSVEDHDGGLDFNLYPNPANDLLILTVSNTDWTNFQLSVLNSVGKLVVSENLSANVNEIDVSVLAPGIYFVSLASEGSYAVKKLVIR